VFGDEESVMKELRKVFYDVLDISSYTVDDLGGIVYKSATFLK
jgi:hypothetical protein